MSLMPPPSRPMPIWTKLARMGTLQGLISCFDRDAKHQLLDPAVHAAYAAELTALRAEFGIGQNKPRIPRDPTAS